MPATPWGAGGHFLFNNPSLFYHYFRQINHTGGGPGAIKRNNSFSFAPLLVARPRPIPLLGMPLFASSAPHMPRPLAGHDDTALVQALGDSGGEAAFAEIYERY